jgi:hypothetical protein
MPTNWESPAGADLAKVLNLTILAAANQNLDANGQPANGQVDPDAPNRQNELVNLAISQIRAAIIKGGRIPLSLTAGSVPTGASIHVLFHAAWQLINTTPNLNMAILTEKGVSTPYAQFYKDACDYIKALEAGGLAPRPSDPTGVDYATAVSATNPAISGVVWGDLQAEDTDYAQGYTLAADGVTHINLPVDDMRTY